MQRFQTLANDFKYVVLSISGWAVAHIPTWVSHLADWFVIVAQICGGLAALLGALKMVDLFLLKRLKIDILNKNRNKTLN